MSDFIYFIEADIPEADSKRVSVSKEILIGSGDEADLQIKGQDFPPSAIKIVLEEDVLTMNCLHEAENWTLAGQALKKDKTHILKEGDTLSLGEVKLRIVQEKQEGESEDTKTVLELEDATVVAPVNASKEKPKTLELSKTSKPSKLLKITEEQEEEEETDVDILLRDGTEKAEEEESRVKISLAKKRIGVTPSFKKPKKVKVAFTDEDTDGPFPGSVVRFLALAITLILVFFLNNKLLPIAGLDLSLNNLIIEKAQWLIEKKVAADPQLSQVDPKVYSYILDYLKKNVETVRFLIMFPLFELFWHLLLGTSLSLAFFGVRDRGGFIGSRLRGGVRALVGCCTLPFFMIYDLPVLFRRRSFKEIITGTHLYCKSWLWTTFACLLVLAGPVAAIYIMEIPPPPALSELLEAPKVVRKKIPPKPKQKGKGKTYSSIIFPLSANPFGTMATMPALHTKKGVPEPVLVAESMNKQVVFSASAIDLSPYLILQDNPAAPAIVEELLTMHWKDAPQLLLRHKEFAFQLWRLRRVLLNHLGHDSPEKRYFVYQGGNRHVISSPTGKNRSSIILTEKEAIYLFTFEGKKIGKLTSGLADSLSRGPAQGKEYSWSVYFSRPSNRALMIFDVFQNIVKGVIPSERQISDIVSYYRKLADSALKEPSIKNILIAQIKKIDRGLKALNNSDPLLEGLNISLNRVQKSMEEPSP